jgi:hypothetical protein
MDKLSLGETARLNSGVQKLTRCGQELGDRIPFKLIGPVKSQAGARDSSFIGARLQTILCKGEQFFVAANDATRDANG